MKVASAEWEYGIQLNRRPLSPHRAGMTRAEAESWLREAIELDGFSQSVFSIIRRPYGSWEPVP